MLYFQYEIKSIFKKETQFPVFLSGIVRVYISTNFLERKNVIFRIYEMSYHFTVKFHFQEFFLRKRSEMSTKICTCVKYPMDIVMMNLLCKYLYFC